MKNARLVAERYAQSLSRAVPDDGVFSRTATGLQALADLVGRSEDLRRALANPLISAGEKLAVLRRLGERLEAGPEIMRFLEALAEHQRLPLLRAVAQAIGRAVDQRLGVVEVEVRAAAALDEDLRRRLTQVLGRRAGAAVRVREIVDPELLGGLVVRIAGAVLDGSLRTHLADLRTRLGRPAAGAA